MKDLLVIFRRFLKKYKDAVFLNILFNFLGALFGIFSFITMIPALRIIFRLDKEVYGYQHVAFSLGHLKEFTGAIQHNLNVFITELSDHSGAFMLLVYIGIFLILMVLFKTGFTYMASYFMVKIRNKVVRDVRNQVYKKVIGLPIGFFTEERKGDIISRMTNDVQEIEVSIVNSLDMLIKNPIIILVSVITMLIMSWELTLFVFVLFPIAGLIIGQVGKSLRKKSMAGQNKLGELLSIIEETLSGFRIIKAFNAETIMDKKFTGENEIYRHIMNKVHWRRMLASPVSEFLGTIVMVVVLWYGGRIILNGPSGLDAANFIVYLVVFYNIINPTKAFTQEYYSVQKGLASMERIDWILNEKAKIAESKNPVKIQSFNESIIYRNVSFKYNKEMVLNEINLTIEKGKTLALVGHSGSGKSTLVDLLPRFYDVTKGEIIIDDNNIKEYKLTDLRGLMGIVNQEPILFNDSFFNNIAFGMERISEEQVIEAAKIANAHEFIITSEQGYYTNIGDRGNKLSGGQKQRISIARAVLKNPPILILDEATSALDTESERLVQDALAKLMKNRTSIIIAHRLSTIVHADEICVISNGEIIERGTHQELLSANGEYKRFYELQNF